MVQQQSRQFNSDNFNLSTDMKVFVDMGHDTIKACQVGDDNWTSNVNHFEIPTVLLKELVQKQKSLLKTSQYDFERKVNTNFKFFKNNIENLSDRVLDDDYLKNEFLPGETFHQRPMINGLIQAEYLDDFEFIWENIGKMFVQGHESAETESRESSWDSLHSRLLMTDPSLTSAANDPKLISMASKQRRKIAEIVFETFGVSEFSLLPAQLPQMFSELCMDGIVVDLGHEQTQIVPIFGGMVDIRKVNTFPVGGITMDSILMKMWRNENSMSGRKVQPSQHKFTQFLARTKFKEEIKVLNQQTNEDIVQERIVKGKPSKFYVLPDNEFLQMDFQDPNMHPINAYLDKEYFEGEQCQETIRELVQGRTIRQQQSHIAMHNFANEIIQPVRPLSKVRDETLFNKDVEHVQSKCPVTHTLFKTMREYSEDEEIKEYEKLQNIIITGGGANIAEFNRDGNSTKETLGSLLVRNFKQSISAESVTGLNVIMSIDARLAILQGAKILMNLSSNSKHYVSSHDYFEAGVERVDLINQILL